MNGYNCIAPLPPYEIDRINQEDQGTLEGVPLHAPGPEIPYWRKHEKEGKPDQKPTGNNVTIVDMGDWFPEINDNATTRLIGTDIASHCHSIGL